MGDIKQHEYYYQYHLFILCAKKYTKYTVKKNRKSYTVKISLIIKIEYAWWNYFITTHSSLNKIKQIVKINLWIIQKSFCRDKKMILRLQLSIFVISSVSICIFSIHADDSSTSWKFENCRMLDLASLFMLVFKLDFTRAEFRASNYAFTASIKFLTADCVW